MRELRHGLQLKHAVSSEIPNKSCFFWRLRAFACCFLSTIDRVAVPRCKRRPGRWLGPLRWNLQRRRVVSANTISPATCRYRRSRQRRRQQPRQTQRRHQPQRRHLTAFLHLDQHHLRRLIHRSKLESRHRPHQQSRYPTRSSHRPKPRHQDHRKHRRQPIRQPAALPRQRHQNPLPEPAAGSSSSTLLRSLPPSPPAPPPTPSRRQHPRRHYGTFPPPRRVILRHHQRRKHRRHARHPTRQRHLDPL